MTAAIATKRRRDGRQKVVALRASSVCMTDAPRPITVAEYEPLARDRTDPGAWDYQTGGAGDEVSLADNRAAGIASGSARGSSSTSPSGTAATTAFGVPLAHPIVVAPTADHFARAPRRRARDGPRSGGHRRGVHAVDDLIGPDGGGRGGRAGRPRWFQLYAPADRDACRALVERAAAAGFSAVVVTVDLPLPGNRERDRRSGFEIDLGTHLPPEQPVDPGDRDRRPARPRLGRARVAALDLPDPAARQGRPARR